jgi:hypothetical protein
VAVRAQIVFKFYVGDPVYLKFYLSRVVNSKGLGVCALFCSATALKEGGDICHVVISLLRLTYIFSVT